MIEERSCHPFSHSLSDTHRAAMVSGAGASGSLAAAAVLSSVYGHITKLARIVVRHAPLQCAGEPLETQAESLAQEYIRQVPSIWF